MATTLATRAWKGCYDFTFNAKLIEHAGKNYLVLDHYCGQDSLHGGCPRPFLYEVPAEELDAVRDAFENPNEMVTPTDTKWEVMVDHDAPTWPLGKRLSAYTWAENW